MAIKLYGHPYSPSVQRARAALEEKQLPYEFEFVDLATGQHKQEPFISINPFGRVPALVDGDLKLFESRAICQYIAHVYADKGVPLLPLTEHSKMAQITVWLEVESKTFDEVAGKLSYELITKSFIGLTTDESVVKEYEEKLGKILDVYESRLSESKYLGGENYSLVDLNHLPIINNLYQTKIKGLFDSRTHVSAWSEDILGRPAWHSVLATLKH